MPDLRQTRKNIQIALAVLVAVDVVAAVVLLSPLVGSTESRDTDRVVQTPLARLSG